MQPPPILETIILDLKSLRQLLIGTINYKTGIFRTLTSFKYLSDSTNLGLETLEKTT